MYTKTDRITNGGTVVDFDHVFKETEHALEPARLPRQLLELAVVEVDATAGEALIDLHAAKLNLGQ